MDKSSELTVSESNAGASRAAEYTKPVPVTSKQIELEVTLEELAEIIEAEGCVLIP